MNVEVNLGPRNADLRTRLLPYTETAAQLIHDTFPTATPDTFTALGVVGTGLSAALAYHAEGQTDKKRRQWLKGASLVGAIGSAATDALDGALARHLIAQGTIVDTDLGAIKDTLSDRTQEAILGLTRAATARRSGRWFGELAAYAATISNPMPSLTRAIAESRGVIVPETGNNVIGFLGTRAGRAIFGVVATIYPDIRNVAAQEYIDTTTFAANMYTTVTRLGDLLVAEESTLSSHQRKESARRAQALAAVTGLIVGATLLTKRHLDKKIPRVSQVDVKQHSLEEINRQYHNTLVWLEQAGQAYLDGSHRFVGGVLPLKYHHNEDGSVVLDSRVKFDFDNRTMHLENHEPFDLFRSDETNRDIDMIDLSSDPVARKKFRAFVTALRTGASAVNLPHPHVGVEGVFYHGGRRRRRFAQLVSAFEEDEDGQQYLAFGNLRVAINPRTLEPWRVVFEDGTSVTMLNPFAHYLCYLLRVPSGTKPKDVQSGSLGAQGAVADEFIRQGLDNGINYMALHTEWYKYIHRLRYRQDVPTWIKAHITNFFWSTIGESVAHGRGVFKPLADKTTGFKG